ncbi:isoleucine--tRNA ligase, partial [Candidatus Microgenomates bacterium]|nr:isoleucine--tRNA ligase [Candidatus Microgenomates bacterium]
MGCYEKRSKIPIQCDRRENVENLGESSFAQASEGLFGMLKNSQKSQFSLIEEAVLKTWEREKTFAKSVEQRKGKTLFSFYDGPPFANGLPHFGHSLVQAIKDSIGRYKTMRGFYVERINGWDCHGLPVEYSIEKQLKVSGKQQILKLGLEKFNAACRTTVFKYKKEWEDFFHRIGRWTDTANAYATIDNSYIESVWWVLSQVHKQGLLYKSFKSMPYCPRCETPLSNFELNEGYQDDVADPSVFVKFKRVGADESFLAWTTTPWSLPGNMALAVHPKETYVTVKLKGSQERLILAQKRLSVLNAPYQILKKRSGRQLVEAAYEPLFTVDKLASNQNNYRVWASAAVDIEDGTGVLHVAPAYGEADLELGQKHNLAVLHNVDTSGRLKKGYGHDELAGMFFKAADRALIERLTAASRVFAAETLKHTYPFCYRCESPLLYYAIDTWFIKVTAIKDKLLRTAKTVNWVPAHVKQGRFGKWLEGARDWAISRNRYWGAPMPVWVNEASPDDFLVVSSIDELKRLAGSKEIGDLHRPNIDKVVIKKGGKTYRRIEEVIDCWVESGSMPMAQYHYPFANKSKFNQSFPADYIGEGLDQTRLWFYVLHVIATVVLNKPAYKNVVVNSMVVAADGQKLSKRLRNYPPIEEVFDVEGADALRLYLLANYQSFAGDYVRFSHDDMKELLRNVLMTLWNVYQFHQTYAKIEGWRRLKSNLQLPNSKHVLDRWILARLNKTIELATEQADRYEIARAINPIIDLIDDLSNWYLRRSRRRFFRSEDRQDRDQAFATLHYVLVRTCQLMAPWVPFLSDKMYRELRTKSMPASVHLTDWPKAVRADKAILAQMTVVREVVAEGLAQRAAARIKIRQPLPNLSVRGIRLADRDDLYLVMADELNVKAIDWEEKGAKQIKLDTTISHEL